MTAVNEVKRIVNHRERVLTVSQWSPVAEAARVMKENGVGSLVAVNEDGETVGIITERDVLGKVVAAAADPSETTVADVMSPKVIACTLSTTIARAQQIMAGNSIRHLPVIEEGRLMGMISSRDILSHQLSTTQAILRRQSRVLEELERQHPGITQIEKDPTGRVVI
jgi:signal-transduction protein with cAMP-binding, CBS, and nucleotidyltransferase domain